MTLTTTIWDVEHGAAAIAQCPNGKAILLDAGCSDSFSPALRLRDIGYGPARQIDQLVVSHPDQDHINDLPQVLEYLKPRILFRNRSIPDALIYRGPGGAPETEAKRIYKHMHETYVGPVSLSDQALPVSNWGGVAMRHFHLDAGKHASLAGNSSCNNYSVVTVLTYGVTTIVFPGDIEDAGMQALMAESDVIAQVSATPLRVLIAAHHGRKAGVSTVFLKAMKPSLTIMSDVHGAETTDYASYAAHSQGLNVQDHGSPSTRRAGVVSTKMNAAIELKATPNDLFITLY